MNILMYFGAIIGFLYAMALSLMAISWIRSKMRSGRDRHLTVEGFILSGHELRIYDQMRRLVRRHELLLKQVDSLVKKTRRSTAFRPPTNPTSLADTSCQRAGYLANELSEITRLYNRLCAETGSKFCQLDWVPESETTPLPRQLSI